MKVTLSRNEVEEAISEYIASRSGIKVEAINVASSTIELGSGRQYFSWNSFDSICNIDVQLASNDKQLMTELLTPRDKLFASQRYIQQQKDDENL